MISVVASGACCAGTASAGDCWCRRCSGAAITCERRERNARAGGEPCGSSKNNSSPEEQQLSRGVARTVLTCRRSVAPTDEAWKPGLCLRTPSPVTCPRQHVPGSGAVRRQPQRGVRRNMIASRHVTVTRTSTRHVHQGAALRIPAARPPALSACGPASVAARLVLHVVEALGVRDDGGRAVEHGAPRLVRRAHSARLQQHRAPAARHAMPTVQDVSWRTSLIRPLVLGTRGAVAAILPA